jgi:hypothetical protein
MRKMFLLLILLPAFAIAQDLPKNQDGKVEFTEVVSIDSASAAALFSNAKIFITNSFKSGKDVTQLDDQNSKTVIGQGNTRVDIKALGMSWPGRVDFKITIQCKDGRYKYSFADFIFNYQAGTKGKEYVYGLESDDHKGINQKQWDSVKEQVNNTMIAAIAGLKKQMSSKDDW